MALQQGLTQVRCCPEISDVSIVECTSNSGSSLIDWNSVGCAAYGQLATHIANTPSYSDISNDSENCTAIKDSTASQHEYSKATEPCRIINGGQQIDAMNDSSVICMSSAEDASDGNANIRISTRIKNRAIREKAQNGTRFLFKCGFGNCREMLESWNARLYHMQNYHGKCPAKMHSCYICKKQYLPKKSLIAHMKSIHISRISFPCPFAPCPKVFSLKNSLKAHTNAVHTKQNVFNCTICVYKSYYKYNLSKHKKRIHGVPNRNASDSVEYTDAECTTQNRTFPRFRGLIQAQTN